MQSPVSLDQHHGMTRCVGFCRLRYWIDDPNEVDPGAKVIVKLEIDFLSGVALAQDLDRQIGTNTRNCLIGKLAVGQSAPRKKRCVRDAYPAGKQAQEAIGSQGQAEVVLLQKIPKIVNNEPCPYRFLWFPLASPRECRRSVRSAISRGIGVPRSDLLPWRFPGPGAYEFASAECYRADPPVPPGFRCRPTDVRIVSVFVARGLPAP